MKIDYTKISELYLKAKNKTTLDLSQNFFDKVFNMAGGYDKLPWHEAFINLLREENGLTINQIASFAILLK